MLAQTSRISSSSLRCTSACFSAFLRCVFSTRLYFFQKSWASRVIRLAPLTIDSRFDRCRDSNALLLTFFWASLATCKQFAKTLATCKQFTKSFATCKQFASRYEWQGFYEMVHRTHLFEKNRFGRFVLIPLSARLEMKKITKDKFDTSTETRATRGKRIIVESKWHEKQKTLFDYIQENQESYQYSYKVSAMPWSFTVNFLEYLLPCRSKWSE